MKALNISASIALGALVAVVGIAYAAQPPNVVASDAAGNTAMGTNALLNLTDGTYNTAVGFYALGANTTGTSNTAAGLYALGGNTTGGYNTAAGFYALAANTTGSLNTATGYSALRNNTTGLQNTATGFYALWSNTSGFNNTAAGFYALAGNMTGNFNTAVGLSALVSNSEGHANTALGSDALYSNSTGRNNVAIGSSALLDNTTGRNNTAIGWYAGRRTTGNDNILIANKGVAGESQTMRLGVKGTAGVAGSGITRTFIAGIQGRTTGLAGSAVLIDANGQLGTISSSRRYKKDIEAMADASERLQQLRPVKFHYKQPDATGEHPIQYGLIAEEVAEVFPELVVRDEQGQPETVAYHLLPALLLNELQKEHRLNQQNAEQLALLQKQLTAQASQLAEVNALKQQLAEVKELLAALQPQAKVLQVAQR